MTSLRFLFACLLILPAALAARGVERWADPKLPVTDGLELWLDAGRIEPGVQGTKMKAMSGGKLGVWVDASGKKRHMKQSTAPARPAVVKVDNDAVVRFDGVDDHLRLAEQKGAN